MGSVGHDVQSLDSGRACVSEEQRELLGKMGSSTVKGGKIYQTACLRAVQHEMT
jgi:hypothetical protein